MRPATSDMVKREFKSYQRLNTWQKADELAYRVYKSTSKFPKHELFGIVSQMRRATLSVPANIAEGYASSTKPGKKRFYNIARSSLAELGYYLYFSFYRLKYLDKSSYERLEQLRGDVGRLLTGLIKSVS